MFWSRRQHPINSDDDALPLTARDVYLRPALPFDYGQWTWVRAKNQAHLKPFEPTWPKDALTPEFFARRLLRLNEDWKNDRGYAFLIFKNDSDDLVGGININNIVRGAAQYASLGYWIDEDHQGRGLMAQAGRAVLQFAFDKILLARMNAACLPHNLRSKNLLLSLGFTEEGFAKRFIQINGKREDHILFGLNEDDFSGGAGNA